MPGAPRAYKAAAVIQTKPTSTDLPCRRKCLTHRFNQARPIRQEAEKRGLKNLRTTPDALPEVLADSTVAAFDKYDVLSKRELESRYEVWIEQYVINANIEAATRHGVADPVTFGGVEKQRLVRLGDGLVTT